MPRRIHLEPHLTDDELHDRYRRTVDPVERSHWHFLWLLAGGMTAAAVAAVTSYSAYWIDHIARRYNIDGPEGMRDRRHALCAGRPALPASHLADLEAAVASPHPDGDRWCGRTVAAWLSQRLGRQVRRQLGWRYLVGFVHPASGRTLFHLATSVSIPLFEVELAHFAEAVGAGPQKQLVLVLDRAGWHTSVRLTVPEHVHLLFLPPYSPELQPAEHLWPLTNSALDNRSFASIEALEDAQLAHCAVLQKQRARIRSTTSFHWWPKQLHKRRGPRLR